MLVSEYCGTHRDVAFYADQLCISSIYLTQVIQEVNGQRAREMIADYVVVEIKSLLRNADLDIKDIVRQIGFAHTIFFKSLFPEADGYVSLGIPANGSRYTIKTKCYHEGNERECL